MKMNLIRLMVLSASLSQGALAQVATSFEPLAMPLPESRMVWEPARSGNGHSFEVTPSGYIFQAWFTYKDGQPSFYTLQGQLSRPVGCPADLSKFCAAQVVQWAESGVTWNVLDAGSVPATTAMRIYESIGGACPTCPQTAPVTAPSSLSPGKLELFGDVVKLTYADARVAVLEPLLSPQATYVASLIGKNGKGRTINLFLQQLGGGGVSNYPNSGITTLAQPGRYGGTLGLSLLEFRPVVRPGDVLDARLPSDTTAVSVDLFPNGDPAICSGLLIGKRPPYVYFTGKLSLLTTPAKCQISSMGEAFFDRFNRRVVLWYKDVWRTPGQPARTSQAVLYVPDE